MKRFFALLVSILLVIPLCACDELVRVGADAALSMLDQAVAGAQATPALPVQTPELLPTEQASAPSPTPSGAISEDGIYDSRDDVALYIHMYGRLPDNYMSKAEARDLGWESGSLEKYAPGKCIGGDRFGNYEGLLPTAKGRSYTECDIGTLGKSSRGAQRIVFSSDGFIYYTEDHYDSFMLLYGEE